MKTELKDIIRFYPMGEENGLVIQRPNGSVLKMLGVLGYHYIFPNEKYGDINFRGNQPHLRSLSQLTEEITHEGETFVPIEVLREMHFSSLCYVNWCSSGNDLDNLSFESEEYSQDISLSVFHEMIMQLYEWHFAVNLDKSQYIEKK